jgi:DNA-binding NtrC family response regulator
MGIVEEQHDNHAAAIAAGSLMSRILIIDDDAVTCQLLADALRHDGHLVVWHNDSHKAHVHASEEPLDLAILGVGISQIDGFDLFRNLRAQYPSLPVIVMTAFGSIDAAVQAISLGAVDYISKPVSLPDLRVTVRRWLHRSWETQAALPAAEGEEVCGLLGHSPGMVDVYRTIALISSRPSTVLILGESGTGKELVARALHCHSGRAMKPLVTVDCAALSETLLESELFGHVMGAFTGAVTTKVGLFVESEGGTIFLDEIGNIPLNIQAKLLRVSEEHEVRPVGGTRSRSVDIRILAATNLDLAAAVRSGSFREDLYYRLRVVTIELPPLRKRREDIPLLVDHLVRRAAGQSGRQVPGVSESALRLLQAYDWPGNVRELSHVLERSVALSKYNVLRVEDLPLEIRTPLTDRADDILTDRPTLATLKRRYIEQVIEESGTNVSRAAAVLGLDRHSLYRMLRRHGIVFRPPSEPTAT